MLRSCRLGIAALAITMALGCSSDDGPQTIVVYHPKAAQAPPAKYCCDATGHKQGATPVALGGTCCCTPTADLMKQLHRDGLLMDYTASRLESAYADRGIRTGNDHQGCNNACQWGPHVVKGGHCLACPTPGTANYDEVISGQFPPAPSAKEKTHAP